METKKQLAMKGDGIEKEDEGAEGSAEHLTLFSDGYHFTQTAHAGMFLAPDDVLWEKSGERNGKLYGSMREMICG